jgi:hypothetical protein
MIFKPLEDQLGLISSADLGVSLHGFLPNGWADYQVAVYGGNGYAKPTETDSNTATDLSLTVNPLPGFSVRGSLYTSTVSTTDACAKEGISASKSYDGVAINYSWGPLWFMWEGVEGMKPNTLATDSNKVSGSSKMLLWTINEQWQVAVREDLYDPDANNKLNTDDVTDSVQDRMIYGVNCQWFKDLLLQLNYSVLKYDGGSQNYANNARYTESQTIMQLKWSF